MTQLNLYGADESLECRLDCTAITSTWGIRPVYDETADGPPWTEILHYVLTLYQEHHRDAHGPGVLHLLLRPDQLMALGDVIHEEFTAPATLKDVMKTEEATR